MNVTSEIVIGITLAILSLVIDYAPKVSEWFESLLLVQKRRFILVSCLMVVLGMLGLDCLNVLDTSLSCQPINWSDIFTLGYNLVYALALMTGFHLGSKPLPQSAKAKK